MSDSTALRPIDKFRADLDASREKFYAVLPAHVDHQRYLEIAIQVVATTPDLIECTQASIFKAIAGAARLGLEIGGVLGEAYIIKYGSEATLQMGWKGAKALAYQSNQVAMLDWGVVREGDEFDYERGTEQFLRHKPRGEDAATWTHVWALGTTVNGGKRFEVMTAEEVHAHKQKYSRGWNRTGSAWQAAEVSMALKTVALKLLRLLPLSVDARRLVEQTEYAESPAAFTGGVLPDGSQTPSEDLDDVTDELEGFVPDEVEQERIRQLELSESQ